MVSDLVDAAIGQANVACVMMQGFAPLDLVAGTKRQNSSGLWEDAGQIAVTGEDRLRPGFIGIQSDKVAEVSVVMDVFPRAGTLAIVVDTGQHSWIGKLVGENLKVSPDLARQVELHGAAIGRETGQSHREFFAVVTGPDVKGQADLPEVGDAVEIPRLQVARSKRRKQQKHQQPNRAHDD